MKQNSEASSNRGFGSKIGFILAAAGSAVGLGNIWRFPYLAAKYGGGIFLLVYLIFAVTFGFALIVTEISIGRRTGKSVIEAYSDVNRKFRPLGWLSALVPALILPYYCVIGGWVLKYMTVFVTGGGSEIASASYGVAESGAEIGFFDHFIGLVAQPSVFFLIYVLVGAVVVCLGVEKGIEKFSKFLMPVLLVLILGISVYTLTLDGAGEGLKYYVLPDFEGFTGAKLMKTIAAAVGQLFYSMSIAMGIMVTYGSYMRREDSIEGSVRQIEIFDTLVAFLAGLMFVTMPKVFDSMPAGQIIGTAFFVLVALAALTSSISLMETVTAVVMEKTKLNRVKSCCIVIVFTIALGMLSVLGYSVWSDFTLFGMQMLDFFDFITNNLMMPVAALFTCILVGYVVKTKYIEDEVMYGERKFRSKLLYRGMIKYVCPVCMLIILVTPFVTEI